MAKPSFRKKLILRFLCIMTISFLLLTYLSYLLSSTGSQKYFIYECIEWCGGLADRQEGIVAAYIISQMLQRTFKLRMLKPCDIANYMGENSVKWTMNESIGGFWNSVRYKRIDESAWELRKQIANGLDLEREFPYDVTYFTANQEMVNYLKKHPLFAKLQWARNKTTPEIYNIVVRGIFKMNPNIQRKFDEFQRSARSKGRQLICAHVRLRGNPTIPNDFYPPHPVNVSVVWKFLRQYNNSDRYRIFVAADSEAVRREAKSLFAGVLQDIEGDIIHVDLSESPNACEGFGKVVLDQQTLASCDVFLMTDSGIGRIAAMLRGKDDGLYCLDNNSTWYRKCSFEDEGFIPNSW